MSGSFYRASILGAPYLSISYYFPPVLPMIYVRRGFIKDHDKISGVLFQGSPHHESTLVLRYRQLLASFQQP